MASIEEKLQGLWNLQTIDKNLDQLQAEKFASEISQKYSVESRGFSVDITNLLNIYYCKR